MQKFQKYFREKEKEKSEPQSGKSGEAEEGGKEEITLRPFYIFDVKLLFNEGSTHTEKDINIPIYLDAESISYWSQLVHDIGVEGEGVIPIYHDLSEDGRERERPRGIYWRKLK